MTTYIKIVLLPFFCLTCLNSSAQTIDCKNPIGWMRLPEKEYVEGTRYLHDDFVTGKVYFDGNSKTLQLPLRLNLHNDEFQYMENDKVLAFAKPSRIDKIVLEDEIFIYLEPSEERNVSGFVKSWSPELPGILTKMTIDFFEKVNAQPFEGSKPDRFVRSADQHYLMKSETEIIRITLVKDLIEILGDHASALSKFAKEEKISRANGAELAKLLDYYRALENYL